MVKVDVSKASAIITLTVLLLGSGICFFVWMAATHWTDLAGVSVAVTFIILGVIQAVIAFFWWRASVRDAKKSGMSTDPVDGTEMTDLRSAKADGHQIAASAPLLECAGDGSLKKTDQTPQSLRSRGSGDPLGSRPFNVSGSIPYVDASQSESSLA